MDFTKKSKEGLRYYIKGLNLANAEGLRARSSLRQGGIGDYDDYDHRQYFRRWRRRFLSSVMAVKLTWASAFRFLLLLLLIAAIATACISLPIEKAPNLFPFLFILAYIRIILYVYIQYVLQCVISKCDCYSFC